MGLSPQHVPFQTSPITGQKRPAPSLLPPFTFEPSHSSSLQPRQAKRLFHASPSKHGLQKEKQLLPTPDPTSSTLVPSSSPPPPLMTTRRPNNGLQRTISTLSERAPLAAVPSIELSEHGEPTLMGRSSNSSHYQLSTNKLISRVHVKATYIASAAPNKARKVQIECSGWNGCKVHCQGRAWDLMKGDTFTSETEDADIMVDVQDARVLLQWPSATEGKVLTPTDSDRSSWEGEKSPERRRAPAAGQGQGHGAGRGSPCISPLRQQARLQSPVSPSPALRSTPATAPSGFLDSNPPQIVPVKVYEDEPSDEDKGDQATTQTQQTQVSTQVLSQNQHLLEASQSTSSSSLSDPHRDFSDNDEENDPIISSFGPFGANLQSRMENVNTVSPLQHVAGNSPGSRRRPLQPLKEESISPQRPGPGSNKRRRLAQHEDVVAAAAAASDSTSDITNYIINQLAYSALSATPLSSLYECIPSHLRYPKYLNGEIFTVMMLELLLNTTACVGAVQRSGKDAAGKRLESEFYYVPEKDDDARRREVVTGLGGRGLRNCRKSHKQYFWRKPK